MKIGIVQFDIAWNDPGVCVERAEPLVEAAAKGGAELVLLPEMFTCGFSFPTGDVAKRAYDVGIAALERWSTKYGVKVAGSIANATYNSEQPRNTIVVAAKNTVIGTYDKIHLFSFADEHKSYQAGGTTLTLEINGLSCSFLICYDLRFPIMWNALAESTDVYCLLANWPQKRHHHWKSLLTARAIDNQAYVVGVNRVGSGGNLEYQGGSLAVSPEGTQLCELGTTEAMTIVDVQKQNILDYRKSFPTLRDQRHDLYQDIRTRSNG